MTENQHKPESPAIILLIVAAVSALMLAIAVQAIDLHFKIGPWLLHHWLVWGSALFILAFTPDFYVRLRQQRNNNSALLMVHIYGGLLAWALASLHFMQHVTRLARHLIPPGESPPVPGTGVVLYLGLVLSVLTGLCMRYRIAPARLREWYLIHAGAALSFFLSIVLHVLKGLKIV